MTVRKQEDHSVRNTLAVVGALAMALAMGASALSAGGLTLPVEAWRLLLAPAAALILLGAHFHTE